MNTVPESEPPTASPPQKPALTRKGNRRIWWFGAVIATSVVLIGLYYVLRQSDSWLIHLYRYQVVRELAPLQARIAASGLAVGQLGRVEYDDAAAQILVARRVLPGARGRLCVFSGVHGNEPASVEASVRFAERVGKDAALYPGLNVTVVPLINPWGWERDLRRNGVNQDISRTFNAKPSAEGDIIRALLKAEHCDVLADLHGDRFRQPFFITTFDNPDLSVARAISREVGARGVPLRLGAPDAVFNRRDKDAINAARPNLGLYARRNGVPLVYIVQSPRQLEFEARVAVHLLALDFLARAIKP